MIILKNLVVDAIILADETKVDAKKYIEGLQYEFVRKH